jgi:hypothetical protein
MESAGDTPWRGNDHGVVLHGAVEEPTRWRWREGGSVCVCVCVADGEKMLRLCPLPAATDGNRAELLRRDSAEMTLLSSSDIPAASCSGSNGRLRLRPGNWAESLLEELEAAAGFLELGRGFLLEELMAQSSGAEQHTE